MTKFLFFFFLISLSVPVVAQTPNRDKFPSYFGLVASPVFPSDFLGTKTTVFNDPTETMTITFNQTTGFMFGASVRIGLTRLMSLETGLTQIRRNFQVGMSIPDSNISSQKTFSFVSYDLPLNALIYVQMTENVFMNASLGMSIAHYPSDIRDTIQPGGKDFLVQEGRRTERTHLAVNAGIGFEYRTLKAGTFYVGGGGKIPLKQIMIGVGVLKEAGSSNQLFAYKAVDGSFLSLDLRYYFPNVRNRGTQFIPGPVEQ